MSHIGPEIGFKLCQNDGLTTVVCDARSDRRCEAQKGALHRPVLTLNKNLASKHLNK